MKIEVSEMIEGSPADVWAVITDIDNSVDTIQAIEKIEVLEKPIDSLIGLKWRETRTMFGQTATEVMWITEAKENEYYKTRAENRGVVYVSTLSLVEEGAHTKLTMGFEGMPQTFSAKIRSALTSKLFENASKKALAQDLKDIKAAVEKS